MSKLRHKVVKYLGTLQVVSKGKGTSLENGAGGRRDSRPHRLARDVGWTRKGTFGDPASREVRHRWNLNSHPLPAFFTPHHLVFTAGRGQDLLTWLAAQRRNGISSGGFPSTEEPQNERVCRDLGARERPQPSVPFRPAVLEGAVSLLTRTHGFLGIQVSSSLMLLRSQREKLSGEHPPDS